MPISPMDEYLAHQTTDTFDYVFTSDRNFYDRYYFNCHPSSGELFLVAGLGQYPNLGVTDAFVSISHGTRAAQAVVVPQRDALPLRARHGRGRIRHARESLRGDPSAERVHDPRRGRTLTRARGSTGE
ncbi:MAG: hypothetical protein ACREI7_13550 [Myxococcota bacterium]